MIEKRNKKNVSNGRYRTAAIVVAVIAVVVLATWVFKVFSTEQESVPSSLSQDDAGIWALEATSVDIDEIASSGLPAVIDFGSDSCAPCKAMAPVLENANESLRGRAIVKFVDVWKHPGAAEGFPVQVIPTQILMLPGVKPYIPSEEFIESSGIELMAYEDGSGKHSYTAHQGALTQAQLDAILADMGV